MFLDCCVCKICAFHNALQVGKQKEVHPPYSPDLVPAGARSGQYGVCFLVPFTEPFRHTTYSEPLKSNVSLPSSSSSQVAIFKDNSQPKTLCKHFLSSLSVIHLDNHKVLHLSKQITPGEMCTSQSF
jgi:hypothetical protein